MTLLLNSPIVHCEWFNDIALSNIYIYNIVKHQNDFLWGLEGWKPVAGILCYLVCMCCMTSCAYTRLCIICFVFTSEKRWNNCIIVNSTIVRMQLKPSVWSKVFCAFLFYLKLKQKCTYLISGVYFVFLQLVF